MKHWRCSHISTGGVEVLYTTEQLQTRIYWICKIIGDGICINVNVCASVHACVRMFAIHACVFYRYWSNKAQLQPLVKVVGPCSAQLEMTPNTKTKNGNHTIEGSVSRESTSSLQRTHQCLQLQQLSANCRHRQIT